MKTLSRFTPILFAAFMMTACTSPAELDLEEEFGQSTSLRTDLAATINALLPGSAWFERSRRVNTTFSCTEGDAEELDFFITERVYKVFTENNDLYYVINSARSQDGTVFSDTGNAYGIDISVKAPRIKKEFSSELYQEMTIAMSSGNSTQFLKQTYTVEKSSAGASKENSSDSHAVEATAETQELEFVPDDAVNSCTG